MDKRIDRFLEEIVEEEQDMVRYKYECLLTIEHRDNTLTPIEVLMLLAIEHERAFREDHLNRLAIHCQKTIGKYRVDFLITQYSENIDGEKDVVSVIIECDGHDFHEKTKEQALSDRARERDLQTDGYSVLRFTGREIWRDPSKCARQVAIFLTEELRRRFYVRHPDYDAVKVSK